MHQVLRSRSSFKNEKNDKGKGVDRVSQVIQATTYNWKDEVIQSQKPLVVEFYSPTCPHCRRLMPIFERLSNEYGDRLKFVMVDASVERDLASGYGVMGVPTLKFICSGRPVGEIVGFRPEEDLRSALDEMLKRYPTCLSQSSPLYT